MTALTERQAEILTYLVSFTLEHGYQPSVREIGEQFGMSSSGSVYEVLQALDRKGAIQLTGQPRGIEIVDWPGQVLIAERAPTETLADRLVEMVSVVEYCLREMRTDDAALKIATVGDLQRIAELVGKLRTELGVPESA